MHNLNAQLVNKTFASLNGKTFTSREDLDNAIYPLYGPLTSVFGGESHRDMTERLIGAKWIQIENQQFVVKLPDLPPTEQPSTPIPVPTQKSPSKLKMEVLGAVIHEEYEVALLLLSELVTITS